MLVSTGSVFIFSALNILANLSKVVHVGCILCFDVEAKIKLESTGKHIFTEKVPSIGR
jgi:hypothetical protein